MRAFDVTGASNDFQLDAIKQVHRMRFPAERNGVFAVSEINEIAPEVPFLDNSMSRRIDQYKTLVPCQYGQLAGLRHQAHASGPAAVGNDCAFAWRYRVKQRDVTARIVDDIDVLFVGPECDTTVDST